MEWMMAGHYWNSNSPVSHVTVHVQIGIPVHVWVRHYQTPKPQYSARFMHGPEH
jgi:hypothetical protein